MNIQKLLENLQAIQTELHDLYASRNTEHENTGDKIVSAALQVEKSWSKSWIGYQSRVYYSEFAIPPSDAIFSSEWGFKELLAIEGTVGDWVLYTFDEVFTYILRMAGNPDINYIINDLKPSIKVFASIKSRIISCLSVYQKEQMDDEYINDIRKKIEEIKPFTKEEIINAMSPHGSFISRDSRAVSEGLQSPPHVVAQAIGVSIKSAFSAIQELYENTELIVSHFVQFHEDTNIGKKNGIKVFIGHGRSKIWKELKDFIQDRLNLQWDEFNRVPIAGITNIARLSDMLNNAAIAFLILTAEDEQIDGKINPRLNVVHEAGLFQGRLGFEKAIILLEEGCEEFSNINGLGQIRFKNGEINAVFEDVRQILEREGLIK